MTEDVPEIEEMKPEEETPDTLMQIIAATMIYHKIDVDDLERK